MIGSLSASGVHDAQMVTLYSSVHCKIRQMIVCSRLDIGGIRRRQKGRRKSLHYGDQAPDDQKRVTPLSSSSEHVHATLFCHALFEHARRRPAPHLYGMASVLEHFVLVLECFCATEESHVRVLRRVR